MVDLGTLEIGLKLDRQTLDRDINTVRSDLAKVGRNVPQINIKPFVDHQPLKDLNEHLDKKVKHLKEVNAYFRNNPVKVIYGYEGDFGSAEVGGNRSAIKSGDFSVTVDELSSVQSAIENGFERVVKGLSSFKVEIVNVVNTQSASGLSRLSAFNNSISALLREGNKTSEKISQNTKFNLFGQIFKGVLFGFTDRIGGEIASGFISKKKGGSYKDFGGKVGSFYGTVENALLDSGIRILGLGNSFSDFDQKISSKLNQFDSSLSDLVSSNSFQQLEQAIGRTIKGLVNFNANIFAEGLEQIPIARKGVENYRKERRQQRRDIQTSKVAEIIQQSTPANIPITPQAKSVLIVSGGSQGLMGQGYIPVAEKFREVLNDSVQIIGQSNPDTDLAGNDPLKDAVFTGLLKTAFGIDKLKGSQLSKDAINMAYKAYSLRQKNKDMPIQLAGYSAGGFVVKQALQILEKLGINDVQGLAFATPTNLDTTSVKNLKTVFGSNDPINLLINPFASLVGGESSKNITSPSYFKHGLDSSFSSNVMKNYLRQIFGDSVKEDSLQRMTDNPSAIDDLMRFYTGLKEVIAQAMVKDSSMRGAVLARQGKDKFLVTDTKKYILKEIENYYKQVASNPDSSNTRKMQTVLIEELENALKQENFNPSSLVSKITPLIQQSIQSGLGKVSQNDILKQATDKFLNILGIAFGQIQKVRRDYAQSNVQIPAIEKRVEELLSKANKLKKEDDLFDERGQYLDLYDQIINEDYSPEIKDFIDKNQNKFNKDLDFTSQLLTMMSRPFLLKNSTDAISSETEKLYILAGGFYGHPEGGVKNIEDYLDVGLTESPLKLMYDDPGQKISAIAVKNPEMSGNVQPFGTVGSSLLKGYYTDTNEIVAQAVAAMIKNPKIKIEILGFSGGSLLAQEAVYLLNKMGYGDRVLGSGTGSPPQHWDLESPNFSPAYSSLDPYLFQNIPKENANLFDRLLPSLLKETRNPLQKLPIVSEHLLYDYMQSLIPFQFFGKNKSPYGNVSEQIAKEYYTQQSKVPNSLKFPVFTDDELYALRSIKDVNFLEDGGLDIDELIAEADDPWRDEGTDSILSDPRINKQLLITTKKKIDDYKQTFIELNKIVVNATNILANLPSNATPLIKGKLTSLVNQSLQQVKGLLSSIPDLQDDSFSFAMELLESFSSLTPLSVIDPLFTRESAIEQSQTLSDKQQREAPTELPLFAQQFYSAPLPPKPIDLTQVTPNTIGEQILKSLQQLNEIKTAVINAEQLIVKGDDGDSDGNGGIGRGDDPDPNSPIPVDPTAGKSTDQEGMPIKLPEKEKSGSLVRQSNVTAIEVFQKTLALANLTYQNARKFYGGLQWALGKTSGVVAPAYHALQTLESVAFDFLPGANTAKGVLRGSAPFLLGAVATNLLPPAVGGTAIELAQMVTGGATSFLGNGLSTAIIDWVGASLAGVPFGEAIASSLGSSIASSIGGTSTLLGEALGAGAVYYGVGKQIQNGVTGLFSQMRLGNAEDYGFERTIEQIPPEQLPPSKTPLYTLPEQLNSIQSVDDFLTYFVHSTAKGKSGRDVQLMVAENLRNLLTRLREFNPNVEGENPKNVKDLKVRGGELANAFRKYEVWQLLEAMMSIHPNQLYNKSLGKNLPSGVAPIDKNALPIKFNQNPNTAQKETQRIWQSIKDAKQRGELFYQDVANFANQLGIVISNIKGVGGRVGQSLSGIYQQAEQLRKELESQENNLQRLLPPVNIGNTLPDFSKLKEAHQNLENTITQIQDQVRDVNSDPRVMTRSGSLWMETSKIRANPQGLQYKKDGVNTKTGASGSISPSAKWNEQMAGTIAVWKDPNSDEFFVVNGHNRLAHAKSQGVNEVKIEIIDAPNMEKAKAQGALKNISEGQGKVRDASDYFRSIGAKTVADIERVGFTPDTTFSRGGGTVKDALGLAQLGDDLYKIAGTSRLSLSLASAIGLSGAKKGQEQQDLLKYLREKGKGLSGSELGSVAQEMASMMRSGGTVTKKVEQGSLLGLLSGEDPYAQEFNLMFEQAKAIAYVQGQFRSNKKLAKQALGTAKSGKYVVDGQAIDVKQAQTDQEKSDLAIRYFDQFKSLTGSPINKAINQSARKILENNGVITEQIGKDLIAGVLKGIEQESAKIPAQQARVADKLVSGIEDPLQIQSPSRVFMEIGRMIVEGLSLGLNSNKPISTLQGLNDKMKRVFLGFVTNQAKFKEVGAIGDLDSINSELEKALQKLASNLVAQLGQGTTPNKLQYSKSTAKAISEVNPYAFTKGIVYDDSLSSSENIANITKRLSSSLSIGSSQAINKIIDSIYQDYPSSSSSKSSTSSKQSNPSVAEVKTSSPSIPSPTASYEPKPNQQTTRSTAQNIVDTVANEVREDLKKAKSKVFKQEDYDRANRHLDIPEFIKMRRVVGENEGDIFENYKHFAPLAPEGFEWSPMVRDELTDPFRWRLRKIDDEQPSKPKPKSITAGAKEKASSLSTPPPTASYVADAVLGIAVPKKQKTTSYVAEKTPDPWDDKPKLPINAIGFNEFGTKPKRLPVNPIGFNEFGTKPKNVVTRMERLQQALEGALSVNNLERVIRILRRMSEIDRKYEADLDKVLKVKEQSLNASFERYAVSEQDNAELSGNYAGGGRKTTKERITSTLPTTGGGNGGNGGKPPKKPPKTTAYYDDDGDEKEIRGSFELGVRDGKVYSKANYDDGKPYGFFRNNGKGMNPNMGAGFDVGGTGRRFVEWIKGLSIKLPSTNKLEDFIVNTANSTPSLKETYDGLKEIFNSIAQDAPGAGRALNFFKDIVVSAFGTAGIWSFREAISAVMRDTTRAFLQMEQIELGVRFTQGSGTDSKMRELMAQSRQLGVDFETVGRGYSKLAIASKDTAIEPQLDFIFSGFLQAFRTRQVNPEAQGRALLALEQMMSKDKISAEELRLQLSEAIPGAMGVGARAMGMSGLELADMLQSGQLTAGQFLPRFSAQLQMESSALAPYAEKSLQGSINKLNSEIFTGQAIIGESLVPVTQTGITALSKVLEVLNNNAQLVTATLLGLAVKLMSIMIPSLVNVASNSGLLTVALRLIGVEYSRTTKTAISSASASAIARRAEELYTYAKQHGAAISMTQANRMAFVEMGRAGQIQSGLSIANAGAVAVGFGKLALQTASMVGGLMALGMAIDVAIKAIKGFFGMYNEDLTNLNDTIADALEKLTKTPEDEDSERNRREQRELQMIRYANLVGGAIGGSAMIGAGFLTGGTTWTQVGTGGAIGSFIADQAVKMITGKEVITDKNTGEKTVVSNELAGYGKAQDREKKLEEAQKNANKYIDEVNKVLTSDKLVDINKTLTGYDDKSKELRAKIFAERNKPNTDYDQINKFSEELAKNEEERNKFIQDNLGNVVALGTIQEGLSNEIKFFEDNERDLRKIMGDTDYENEKKALQATLERVKTATDNLNQALKVSENLLKQVVLGFGEINRELANSKFGETLKTGEETNRIRQQRASGSIVQYEFDRRMNQAQRQSGQRSLGFTEQAIRDMENQFRKTNAGSLGIKLEPFGYKQGESMLSFFKRQSPEALGSITQEIGKIGSQDDLSAAEREIIEQAQRYLGLLQEQVTIKGQTLDLEIQNRQLERDRRLALRDFDRSKFDLALQIDNAVRQRAIEIRNLVRQQDDQFNQNRVTVRNILQSYVDLNIQVNRRALELRNNLDQVKRNIERMQLGLELSRLANPGDGLFNGFIDIVDRISGAFDNYYNEEGNINLQALDAEQQRLQVARQVRDIQEQIYNYELQRMRQAEDLANAHDSFIRNQANTWLSIQRRVEDMEVQAKQMGVSFTSIAYTLDAMNQIYARLYSGLVNMSSAVGSGYSAMAMMMSGGTNGLPTPSTADGSTGFNFFGSALSGLELPAPPSDQFGVFTASNGSEWGLPTIQQALGMNGFTLNSNGTININGRTIDFNGNLINTKPITLPTSRPPNPPNYGIPATKPVPTQPTKPVTLPKVEGQPTQVKPQPKVQTFKPPSSAQNRVYLPTPSTNVNPQTGQQNKASEAQRRQRMIEVTTGNEFYQGGIPIIRNQAIISQNTYEQKIIAKDVLTKIDDAIKRGEIIVKLDPKEKILSFVTTTGNASRLISNNRFSSPRTFSGADKDEVIKFIGTQKQRVVNPTTFPDWASWFRGYRYEVGDRLVKDASGRNTVDTSGRGKAVPDDVIRTKQNFRRVPEPNPNKKNNRASSNETLLAMGGGIDIVSDMPMGLIPKQEQLIAQVPVLNKSVFDQMVDQQEALKDAIKVTEEVITPARSNTLVDPRLPSSPTVPITKDQIQEINAKEQENARVAQELTGVKFTENLLRLNTELRKILNDVVNLRRRLEDEVKNMQRGIITDKFSTQEFLMNAKGGFLSVNEQAQMARARSANETFNKINELTDKIIDRERQVNVSQEGILATTDKVMQLFAKNKIQPPKGLDGEGLIAWTKANANLPEDQKMLLEELLNTLGEYKKIVDIAPQFIQAQKDNISAIEAQKNQKDELAERQARLQGVRDLYSGLTTLNNMIGNAMVQNRGENFYRAFAFLQDGVDTQYKADRAEMLNPDRIAQTVKSLNEQNPDNPVSTEYVTKMIETGLDEQKRRRMFETSGYNEVKQEFGQLADMMNAIGGQLNQRGDLLRGNWLTSASQAIQAKIQSNDMRVNLLGLRNTAQLTQQQFDSLNKSIDEFEKNSLAKIKVDSNFIVAGLVEPIKGAINGMATIFIDGSKSFWEKVNDVAVNFLTGIANHFANNFATSVTTWITEWLANIIPFTPDLSTGALDKMTIASLDRAGIQFNTAANVMLGAANTMATSAGVKTVSGGGLGGLFQTVAGSVLSPASFLGASDYGFASGIKLTPFGFAKGGEVENYANGGLVEQAQKALARERLLGGGKAVLSALTVGEYVIPKNPSKKDIAKAYAHVPMLRNMQIENYAKGGMVGSSAKVGNITTNNSRMESRDNSFVSNIYVNANDASSFRKTRYQLEMEENARIARASRRFG